MSGMVGIAVVLIAAAAGFGGGVYVALLAGYVGEERRRRLAQRRVRAQVQAPQVTAVVTSTQPRRALPR
jgi:hypothetical protein